MILVFRSLDFPLLVELLILATMVLLVFVALRWAILLRLARKPSRYARAARTDEWLSPQAPAAALALIEESLREHAPKVRTQIAEPAGELRTSLGSDAVFRFKGSGSRKGWAALLLAATFRVAPDGAGSRVIGEIRDDFGWSVVEPPAVRGHRGETPRGHCAASRPRGHHRDGDHRRDRGQHGNPGPTAAED